MNIDLIVVGKIKEKYYQQAINEYLKRMTPYAKVRIIEVIDEATKDRMSEAEVVQVLEKEGQRILSHLKSDMKIWVMAIEGDLVTSEVMAKTLADYRNYGNSKLAIIIGGSLGLSQTVKAKADALISFGRITLPHQLMRVIMTEQIYRAFRIIHGHAYHK